MRLPDLADWFADTLADHHGCLKADQRRADSRTCADCRERADVLALAWSERFPWSDRL